MSGCDCQIEVKNREETRVLIWLIAINTAMFVLELVIGFLSESTALIADSLDMLADATVYAISLYAVGKAVIVKAKAAHISGIFQLILGLFVAIDVIRRFFVGSEPEHIFMISIGFVALIANSICILLIAKHRHGEVHMRASWIFTKNDAIANIGIIVAGFLVYYLSSPYPDLIIGLAIALVVVRGGIQIIRDAKDERDKFSASMTGN
ncbi:MAG: cation transporter [Gammaproteobacteria bacterium]|nr:cation transporter [Gammaproteobacteria bacterium]